MSDVVIRVHELGKSYLMAPKSPGERRDTLVAAMRSTAYGMAATLRRRTVSKPNEFWALKDVSFEVNRGEVVGIVGRNGAGKSTLLKILSRITEPTTGHAQLTGRVGSLLEVGTGFHPELSGRDNTYLNGAILGMRKAEIDDVFSEIVEFSEIEKFIDAPVKTYSSGMFSRLAFSVAAHLRPEIMLIDEVLSVGDMAFQEKCIGKMEEVTGQGRTVLFVSHDMRSVARLCHRTVLLNHGGVEMIGPTSKVVNHYFLNGRVSKTDRTWPADYNPRGTEHCRLLSARLMSRKGQPCDLFTTEEDILVEVMFDRLTSDVGLVTQVRLDTAEGVHAFTASNYLDEEQTAAGLPTGVTKVIGVIPRHLLNEGTFRVMVAIHTYQPFFFVHHKEVDALGFTVIDAGGPSSFRRKYNQPLLGIFRPNLHWESSRV